MVRSGGGQPLPHHSGTMRLSTPGTTVLLETPGEYVKLDTNIVDGENAGFTLVDGRLTFVRPCECKCKFTGIANVKADKTCEINFALYVNGVIRTDIVTPITFDHANSYKPVAAGDVLELTENDYVEVFASSDTASTTLTLYYFSVVLWGI